MSNNYILERIRLTRERRGMGNKHMLGPLNVTQSTYSKKENGELPMKLDELFKIAECLDVPVSYLTTSEEEWVKVEELIQYRELDNKQRILEQSHEIGQLKKKITRITKKHTEKLGEKDEDYKSLKKENAKLVRDLGQAKTDLSDLNYRLNQLSKLAEDLENAMMNETLEFFTLPKIESLFENAGFDDLDLTSDGRKSVKSLLKIFQNAFKEMHKEFQVRLRKIRIIKG
jgi:transcriptional regulator with XRE-family HTH domain